MKIVQLFSDKTKRVSREALTPLENYCVGLYHSPKHEMLLLLADDGKTLLHLASGSLEKAKSFLDMVHSPAQEIDDFLSNSMHKPYISETWKQAAIGG